MNNEDKILEMLSGLTEKVEKMDQRLEKVDQRLEEVDQRSIRTQVLLENDITDRLQLLYEGHQTLLETLAPKSRVEVLEDDVSLLKDVVKLMRQEISELKKAQ